MLLIGSVGNRASLLQAAAQRCAGRVTLVDWREVLADDAILDLHIERARRAGQRWCKIDPPPSELADTLITRGWQAQTVATPRPGATRHGELAYLHWWYAGLAGLLTQLAAKLASLRLLNPIEHILLMCDKWACQQHLRKHAVQTPELLGEVRSLEEFESAFPARDHPAVFIKARYGSCAAGVIALRRHPDGRLAAYTSARLEAGRIYNHLHISRYSQRCTIQQLIDTLCQQGAYAERWIPKPRVPHETCLTYDLRVVAFCGVARQRIARMSSSPLTNLHLGNRRAHPNWITAEHMQGLDACIAQAAAAFDGSRNIGFDVSMVSGRACVIEANAFGDLLPGLQYAGATTHDDQMHLVCRDER